MPPTGCFTACLPLAMRMRAPMPLALHTLLRAQVPLPLSVPPPVPLALRMPPPMPLALCTIVLRGTVLLPTTLVEFHTILLHPLIHGLYIHRPALLV